MRMNISVPDDLAERVRAHELPISSICQSALKTAADAADKRAALAGDLTSVAARLRNTVTDATAEQRLEGYGDGGDWAKEWASLAELKSLVELGLPSTINTPHSIVDFLGDRLGQSVTGVRVGDEDADYWRGFLEGARDIFKAVEPLI